MARESIKNNPNVNNVTLAQADFFKTDWNKTLSNFTNNILIVGNPPWITNSELSILNCINLPHKSNFQNKRGIEAITGSGNFDISEWMLLQYIKWLSSKNGTIAVLCKYAVARKVIKKDLEKRFSISLHLLDAQKYFNAAVEACLFLLSTSENPQRDCPVYADIKSQSLSYVIGKRDGLLLRDTRKYEHWQHLAGKEENYLWRSGVKHDCSKIMELERVNQHRFQNGIKKQYDLEENYLYPLLKSSDIANGRINNYRKLILITQKYIGEDTSIIKYRAPQTWQYLLEHQEYFDNRKSSIYKKKPPYSIFGVGSYTFKNWKIAISGFYKQLRFYLVSPLDGKPVIFDDTVNFLSFDTEAEANFIFSLITSQPALEFLDSLIFWDDKRPITIDILRHLSLKAVAKELGVLENYLYWVNQD